MGNESETQDIEKLSSSEFVELLVHLADNDLMATEYRINEKWVSLMIFQNHNKSYICNLCKNVISSINNIKEHLEGKKHKSNIRNVKQWFHPQYTCAKQQVNNTITKNIGNDKLANIKKIALVKAKCISVKQSPNKEDAGQNEDNVKNSIKDEINQRSASLMHIEEGQGTMLQSSNKSDDCILVEKNTPEIVISDDESSNIANTPLKIPESNDSNEETRLLINPFAIIKNSLRTATNSEPEPIPKCDDIIIIDDKSDAEIPQVIEVHTAESAAKKINIHTINSDNNAHLKSMRIKPHYQTNIIITPRNCKNSTNTKLNNQNIGKNTVNISTNHTSDNEVQGLIGVEYVVKIIKSRRNMQPSYECGLCEVKMDLPAMQSHLVGYNHRLKFCEKHFPTALRQYRQYMLKLPEHEIFKVMTIVLKKLSTAIELHHGRNVPFECNESEYSFNRHDVLLKVFACKHASELNGPTFTHVIDSKEIDILIEHKDQFKTNVDNSQVIFDDIQQRSYGFQPVPTTNFLPQISNACTLRNTSTTTFPSESVDNETHKQMVAQFLQKNTNRHDKFNSFRQSLSNTEFYTSEYNYSSENRKRCNSRSPTSRPHKRHFPAPPSNEDVWKKYQNMVDDKSNDLNNTYNLYKNEPEAHPMYKVEWQQFWKRRKEELISSGEDYTRYNYQPEWVRYFEERISELYNEALQAIKFECRQKVFQSKANENLGDLEHNPWPSTSKNVSRKTEGWERNSETFTSMRTIPTAETRVSKSNNTRKDIVLDGNDKVDEKNVSVISVLRLLSALEEHLGILGPKVVNLLSKTLQLEKSFPNQINNEVLTVENCTLLETAKEKFKGLIIAGFLDMPKERALKKAVNETECLLKIIAKERANTNFKDDSSKVPDAIVENPSKLPKQKKSIANNYIDLLARADNKELAAKLASTLMAQGKTDIDQDNLQQLITVYTLLEKKKQAMNIEKNAKAFDQSSVLTPESNIMPEHSNLQNNSHFFMRSNQLNKPTHTLENANEAAISNFNKNYNTSVFRNNVSNNMSTIESYPTFQQRLNENNTTQTNYRYPSSFPNSTPRRTTHYNTPNTNNGSNNFTMNSSLSSTPQQLNYPHTSHSSSQHSTFLSNINTERNNSSYETRYDSRNCNSNNRGYGSNNSY